MVSVRPLPAEIETHALVHNGYSRPYLVYKPPHLSPHPAVVFMLGGTGSTASFSAQEFGWTEEADRNHFLVVFPEPVPTRPDQPMQRHSNPTFWEMMGSRTHLLARGALPVDDDGYLMNVLHDVERREDPDEHRIFFAGFSSGSGMVQLFAARHPDDISAIAAIATPLMDPPVKLGRPIPVLYIHGDNDEQLSGFEVHNPHFATTPHGNWVTWGYLDGCRIQTAKRKDWGVQFSWQGCRNRVPVIADFVTGVGHEWLDSKSSREDVTHPSYKALDFTAMSWQFFAGIRSK